MWYGNGGDYFKSNLRNFPSYQWSRTCRTAITISLPWPSQWNGSVGQSKLCICIVYRLSKLMSSKEERLLMSRNCPTPESAGRSTTMMEIPIQKGIFSKEFIYSSRIEIFFSPLPSPPPQLYDSCFNFQLFFWSIPLKFLFDGFFLKKRDNAISLTWIVIWKMCLILDIFLTNDMNRKNWHFPKDWFIISIVNRRFGPRNRISMPIKIIQYCHRIIITIL